jgi:hypothetical protein
MKPAHAPPFSANPALSILNHRTMVQYVNELVNTTPELDSQVMYAPAGTVRAPPQSLADAPITSKHAAKMPPPIYLFPAMAQPCSAQCLGEGCTAHNMVSQPQSSGSFYDGTSGPMVDGVEYYWYCCQCGQGANNHTLNPGCTYCYNHNRCEYCIVEVRKT